MRGSADDGISHSRLRLVAVCESWTPCSKWSTTMDRGWECAIFCLLALEFS